MGQSQGLPVPEDNGGRSQESEEPLEVGGAPCRLGSQSWLHPRAPGGSAGSERGGQGRDELCRWLVVSLPCGLG